MYKILVIVKTTSGSMDGGVSVAIETLSYDNDGCAEKAYRILKEAAVSGVTVVKLF